MTGPASPLVLAVRSLAATLVAAGRTRFELFGIEFAEQKQWLSRLILGVAVAAVCLGMTLLVFTGWVVAAFWDTPHRMLAFGLVGLFWLLLGALAAWRAWIAFRTAPPPFEATLAELERDVQALAGAARVASSAASGPAAWPVDPDAPRSPDHEEHA